MIHRIRYWLWEKEVKWKLQRIWERLIGMRLAVWMDTRHPDWCWADICTDLGLGWNIFGYRRAKNSQLCQKDRDEQGCCWCGKMCLGRAATHDLADRGKVLKIS